MSGIIVRKPSGYEVVRQASLQRAKRSFSRKRYLLPVKLTIYGLLQRVRNADT